MSAISSREPSPWFWVVVLGLTSAAGCNVASQGMNVEGSRMYQQGNYQGASEKFLQAIAHDPQNADGYYNLAATYHRVGKLSGNHADFTQAEYYYNQCLEYDSNHSECYRGLAVLLSETGRADAAQRLLTNWVAASPNQPNSHIELARLRDELGDPQAARTQLLEALSIDPNNARALTALGKHHEDSGNYQQALAVYERSLSVNRAQPQVQMRVASLQTALGSSPRPHTPGDTRLVNQPLNWNRY